jgi:hypothetical protein
MTPRGKKLLENYVRKTVRRMLKEADTSSGKVYVLKGYEVMVNEDDYEKGEGKQVNQWSEKVNEEFSSVNSMIDYINQNVIYTNYKKENFEYEDGVLWTDVFVDSENSPPSESEKKSWKQGKTKLYNAHYRFNVKVYNRTEADFDY